METENICCNCNFYDGVNGVPGVAPCKAKLKMVLWDNTCDGIWLIPKRLKIGTPSNADRIRTMTDEEMASFFESWIQNCACNAVPCRIACEKFISREASLANIDDEKSCSQCWLEWLKRDAELNHC